MARFTTTNKRRLEVLGEDNPEMDHINNTTFHAIKVGTDNTEERSGRGIQQYLESPIFPFQQYLESPLFGLEPTKEIKDGNGPKGSSPNGRKEGISCARVVAGSRAYLALVL